MKIRLIAVIVGLLVSISVAEIALRGIGKYDDDGNYWIFGMQLCPCHLPLSSMSKTLKEASDPSSIVRFDSALGWAPRENATSRNGLVHYSAQGIRRPTEVAARNLVGKHLRIAVFGDSYTHGDGVGYEDSWAYLLEKELRHPGQTVEVLNFGVGGYGMDQAYLRWKELGAQFNPDVVIFGLQTENMGRNLNIFRPLYFNRTDLPFSKPRYLLSEDSSLRPVNLPVIPIQDLVATLQNIESSILRNYEHFYKKRRLQQGFWLRSKLLALLVGTIETLVHTKEEEDLYKEKGEGFEVSRRIVEKFHEDVTSTGAKFLVVYLPNKVNLERSADNTEYAGSALVNSLSAKMKLVDPTQDLLNRASLGSVADLYNGHYTPTANQIIALSISKEIGKSPSTR